MIAAFGISKRSSSDSNMQVNFRGLFYLLSPKPALFLAHLLSPSFLGVPEPCVYICVYVQVCPPSSPYFVYLLMCLGILMRLSQFSLSIFSIHLNAWLTVDVQRLVFESRVYSFFRTIVH